MNANTAHRIVLISALVVFSVGWFESAEKGEPIPPARFIIGGATAFLVISIISDIEPGVGGALALAIATTVFLAKSNPLLSYVNQTVQQKKPQQKKPTPRRRVK